MDIPKLLGRQIVSVTPNGAAAGTKTLIEFDDGSTLEFQPVGVRHIYPTSHATMKPLPSTRPKLPDIDPDPVANRAAARGAPLDMSRYNAKCGACGSPAYRGLGPVLCSNKSCAHAEP